ncbi:MAG TPA: HNH endonuclease signature motif containing protein [Humisphaera sp.]
MDRATQHIVRLRAGGLCEYCRLPESLAPGGFAIDHIIARQHRGQTVPENLALACVGCNLSKGPNIASLDPPGTGELTRLFNPRTDDWLEHFAWDGGMLVGRTAVGRATILVLDVNDPVRVDLRQSLMDEGTFPQDPKPPTNP